MGGSSCIIAVLYERDSDVCCEQSEEELRVADVGSIVTSEDWKKHDNAKVAMSKTAKFRTRGLRTRKHLTPEQKAEYARVARSSSSVGKAYALAKLERTNPLQAPNAVKRNRPPPRSRHQPPPQPIARAGDIDKYLSEQEKIGDWGTGETRGNCQEDIEDCHQRGRRGFGVPHHVCCQQGIVAATSTAINTQIVRHYEEYRMLACACGEEPILSVWDVMANRSCPVPGLTEPHTLIECDVPGEHHHFLLLGCTRSWLRRNGLMYLLRVDERGNAGLVMDDKLLTTLGLLPGNRQTSTPAPTKPPCKFEKQTTTDAPHCDFVNQTALERCGLFYCSCCGMDLFAKDGRVYHPTAAERKQYDDIIAAGLKTVAADKEKEKVKDSVDPVGPTNAPSTSSTPPPVPITLSPQRPLLGKELSHNEHIRMIVLDGRASWLDTLQVRRGIQHYTGDNRIVGDLPVKVSPFDYAFVELSFMCLDIPLPPLLRQLFLVLTNHSLLDVTRFLGWNGTFGLVTVLFFLFSFSNFIALFKYALEITVIHQMVYRIAMEVLNSDYVQRLRVQRHLCYVPHGVTSVEAELPLRARSESVIDSVKNRLRVSTTFPFQDESMTEQLYGTSLAVLAHIDIRDFRRPVVASAGVTYVDSFDQFSGLQRPSAHADLSPEQKSTPTATESQKSPSHHSGRSSSSGGRRSPPGRGRSPGAKTSDDSQRGMSKGSGRSVSTDIAPKQSAPLSTSGLQVKLSHKTSRQLRRSADMSSSSSCRFSSHYAGSSASKSGLRPRLTPKTKRTVSANITTKTMVPTHPSETVLESQPSSSSKNTEPTSSAGSSTAASMPLRLGAAGSSNQ